MGLVHLDAGVIIGFLDGSDAHHRNAVAALSNALQSGDRLALAASALAESLVGPARQGSAVVDTVRTMIERIPIAVVAADAEIATLAAEIRAGHTRLKLPDALVIATATIDGADRLVTTDRKWPTAQAMNLELRIDQI